MMNVRTLLVYLLVLSRSFALTFQDDDTVVLLGNTVVERAQHYGHLETALTLASGKSGLHFRNLGWSGDTVYGDARSYFGPPEEGFERLRADLAELKPQVVILCYGAVAAFEGEAGLENFLRGYERLLDMIASTASPREIVLVSPPPAESKPAPMPDMTEHNLRLALYRDAIREFARKRDHQFVDLFGEFGNEGRNLTDDSLHYTEPGYRVLAHHFMKAANLTPPSDLWLESESGCELREAIIAKNKLFFFKWRPTNETYLRLFRKHEQGQNAKELLEFDPLIKNAEKQIEALRQTTLKLQP